MRARSATEATVGRRPWPKCSRVAPPAQVLVALARPDRLGHYLDQPGRCLERQRLGALEVGLGRLVSFAAQGGERPLEP